LRVVSVKPRTLMSSTMRAHSALTDRWDGWEVMPTVAGPSMLGIGARSSRLTACLAENAQTLTSARPRERFRSGWALAIVGVVLDDAFAP
jgi:hypothetical protein